MKKLLTLFVLISVCTLHLVYSQNSATGTGASAGMLNLNRYGSHFGFKSNRVDIESKYIWEAEVKEIEQFGGLAGDIIPDVPVEFALLSYFSPAVKNIRPYEAIAMLPANNPKLAELKLGAAVFQEIQVLRFLGNTAAVTRHENMLKFITDRRNVTRTEVENFYRQGIRGLVTEIVNEEFSGITVPAATVTHIKQSLTNFFTTPNQANFNILQNIASLEYRNLDEAQTVYGNAIQKMRIASSFTGEEKRIIEELYQVIFDVYEDLIISSRRIINAPNDAPINWNNFGSAYHNILNGLDTKLIERMRTGR